MSLWELLWLLLLKDCLSFVIQPFTQTQKANISLAFFEHRRQAQKGFTEGRCEPAVATAKNRRSIRSDSQESLWRLRTGPAIPLWILKPVFAGALYHIRFNQEREKHDVIVLTAYFSLLHSPHCKQFYSLKGCLEQPLLSKTQQITFKINKTLVSGMMNPKIPPFFHLFIIYSWTSQGAHFPNL